MNERDEAMLAAYESARDRMPLTEEQFRSTFSTWDVHPVRVMGSIVGAVLVGGNQIHACIKPDGFKRWLTKGVLTRTLRRVIDAHGKAITSITTGNEAGEQFVKRLGFEPFAQYNGVTWYEAKNKNGH